MLLNYLPKEIIGTPTPEICKIRVKNNLDAAGGNSLHYWQGPGDWWVMLFFWNIFDYCWCYYVLINIFHQVYVLFKYFKCQFLEEELESVPHLSSMWSASLASVGKLPPIDILFFHFPTMYFIKRSNSVHVGGGKVRFLSELCFLKWCH